MWRTLQQDATNNEIVLQLLAEAQAHAGPRREIHSCMIIRFHLQLSSSAA
jgi:hypothetical protein